MTLRWAEREGRAVHWEQRDDDISICGSWNYSFDWESKFINMS